MCLHFPGTGWGIGRKQYTTFFKTTWITLMKVLAELKIPEGAGYSYKGDTKVMTFTNNSQIFILDMAYQPSDPLYTRLGGLELTGAAIDESVEIEYEAIEILFTRLGRRLNHYYGLPKKMLETFNPAKNHVYRRYYKPWKDGTLRPTYAFVRALPTDNPSPEVEEYVKGILENSTRVTIERLVKGNFEYEDDPEILVDYDALLDIATNGHIKPDRETRYITADIALQGSDRFMVAVWYGWVCVEIEVMEKSGGRQVVDLIRKMMTKHAVFGSRVIYDSDGVGGFIGSRGGFIPAAKAFHGGGKPFKRRGKQENYENLKTQCAYEVAKVINERKLYIPESALPRKKTAQQVDPTGKELEMLTEDINGSIRARDVDKDGKLRLKKKEDVKRDLGRSPEYADIVIMRQYIELMPKPRPRRTTEA
ncbi:hypothetical protein KC887_00540 [Candidatus Kaiserbacteria bacterium]|nr:hypothetical protein [Candidatus Kaiserbacteria bacterium]